MVLDVEIHASDVADVGEVEADGVQEPGCAEAGHADRGTEANPLALVADLFKRVAVQLHRLQDVEHVDLALGLEVLAGPLADAQAVGGGAQAQAIPIEQRGWVDDVRQRVTFEASAGLLDDELDGGSGGFADEVALFERLAALDGDLAQVGVGHQIGGVLERRDDLDVLAVTGDAAAVGDDRANGAGGGGAHAGALQRVDVDAFVFDALIVFIVEAADDLGGALLRRPADDETVVEVAATVDGFAKAVFFGDALGQGGLHLRRGFGGDDVHADDAGVNAAHVLQRVVVQPDAFGLDDAHVAEAVEVVTGRRADDDDAVELLGVVFDRAEPVGEVFVGQDKGMGHRNRHQKRLPLLRPTPASQPSRIEWQRFRHAPGAEHFYDSIL